MRNLLLHLSWKEYIVDQAGLIRTSYLLCAILLVFSRIVRQTVQVEVILLALSIRTAVPLGGITVITVS